MKVLTVSIAAKKYFGLLCVNLDGAQNFSKTFKLRHETGKSALASGATCEVARQKYSPNQPAAAKSQNNKNMSRKAAENHYTSMQIYFMKAFPQNKNMKGN